MTVKVYGMYSVVFHKTERFTPEVREKVLHHVYSEDDEFLSQPETMDFRGVMLSYFKYRKLGLQHGEDFIFLNSLEPLSNIKSPFPTFTLEIKTEDGQQGYFMIDPQATNLTPQELDEWRKFDEELDADFRSSMEFDKRYAKRSPETIYFTGLLVFLTAFITEISRWLTDGELLNTWVYISGIVLFFIFIFLRKAKKGKFNEQS